MERAQICRACYVCTLINGPKPNLGARNLGKTQALNCGWVGFLFALVFVGEQVPFELGWRTRLMVVMN